MAEQLGYSYAHGCQPVLKDLCFSVNRGEALGVIGLNGSGKTTLSYCLCGIIPHHLPGTMMGRVLVNGQDTKKATLASLASEIGIVLQDPNLQLLMPTVEDDLAFALENHNCPREEIGRTIEQVMDQVGIAALRHKNPNRLSGGEKQLAALATVLALKPPIIIFDEALAMLDQRAREKIVAQMWKLKLAGTTLIIIDHTRQGLEVCDNLLLLEKGRIIRRGPRETILADRVFLREHRLIFSRTVES